MQLSTAYRDALGYAFDLHRTQERTRSGVPYVAHLIGVSSLTLEYGGDEEQGIAALLHDSAEDQGGEATLREIETRFGPRVARIVRACTDALETPKPPWRDRKERYLQHLKTTAAEAQLVAACDKLYNLRAIVGDYRHEREAVWSRFSGGREGVLWYYTELTRTFTLHSGVVEELQRTLQQLNTLLGEA